VNQKLKAFLKHTATAVATAAILIGGAYYKFKDYTFLSPEAGMQLLMQVESYAGSAFQAGAASCKNSI
jgi:hypothetical protein